MRELRELRDGSEARLEDLTVVGNDATEFATGEGGCLCRGVE